MMKHGIKIDMVPPKYGGKGAIVVDREKLPFEFDDEKLFLGNFKTIPGRFRLTKMGRN